MVARAPIGNSFRILFLAVIDGREWGRVDIIYYCRPILRVSRKIATETADGNMMIS